MPQPMPLPEDLQALLIELGRASLEHDSQVTFGEPLPDHLAADDVARRAAQEWCSHYKQELSLLGRFAAQSLRYLGTPPNQDFGSALQGFTNSIATGATRRFLAERKPTVYLTPLITSNLTNPRTIGKMLTLVSELGEYAIKRG